MLSENNFSITDLYSYINNFTYANFLISLSIFSIFFFFRLKFSRLFISKVEIFTKKLFGKKNTLVKHLHPPVNFLPIFIGFFLSILVLDYDEKYQNLLNNLNKTFLTILIFWFVHQLVLPLALMTKSIEKILSRDLINWMANATKILIIIIGASSVLELWGIKVGPIIAGLGLFGVAVALGAQDLFKNLISGILVLVERRFEVGNVIEVEGVVEGVVEKISFRSTTIRKFDKSLCTIPNFQFAENPVINISKISNRRINWIIGLEYGSTVDQLRKVRDDIEKYIKNDVDFNITPSTPVIVRIDKFSDSSIDILVRCFTKTNEYKGWVDVKDKLAIRIKEIVEERGAGFAFPSQSLYIEKK
ncbi:mechanosensitive ion channel family protein [Alphaproteobacteria bacterium]|nr:mechanosensitive ion channel family protein [Alphaproteobacteria bacterium]